MRRFSEVAQLASGEGQALRLWILCTARFTHTDPFSHMTFKVASKSLTDLSSLSEFSVR